MKTAFLTFFSGPPFIHRVWMNMGEMAVKAYSALPSYLVWLVDKNVGKTWIKRRFGIAKYPDQNISTLSTAYNKQHRFLFF